MIYDARLSRLAITRAIRKGAKTAYKLLETYVTRDNLALVLGSLSGRTLKKALGVLIDGGIVVTKLR